MGTFAVLSRVSESSWRCPLNLFGLQCGEYTFLNFSTHEKCGGTQDAFGFVYAADKAIKLSLMPTEGAPTLLYIPSFDIALHRDYLKVGTSLDKNQVRATCSRFKKEEGDDPTYYTVPAKTVTLKVVEYRGEQEYRILDDHTRWERANVGALPPAPEAL